MRDQAPLATVSPEFQGPSLSQVAAIVRAHWKATLAIFAATFVLSGIVAQFIPKTYKATATLIVNFDINDPLAGKEIPIQLLGNYMATQTELMESPEILDTVIDRLNLAADDYFASGNRGGEGTLHDWITTQLRKNLDIEEGHSGSQLIYISAYARNPDTAANIANAIGEVYNERHFQQVTGPASERAKRYTEELADLKQKVQVAQDTLTQLRRRTGQIEFDGKTDVEGDKVIDLEHRLTEAQATLRAAQMRVSADPGAVKESASSEVVRSLRSEANTLRAKMAQLRTLYGAEHPQVIELQSQIDANAKSLNEALSSYSSTAAADVNAARQDVEQLQAQIAAEKQNIVNNRSLRDQASKYQLELEAAQSVYKRALDGYDKIMFASSGQNSDINFISRARPPAATEKRKTLMILLLGALGGLALGLGAPFAYELLHRRIRCRDDVERDLGVPVLIEFLAIPAPAQAAA